MKKKNIINSILQNTRMPEGFFGRIILRGMNKGHASLSRWGLSQIEWKSDWTILDIGCGGGANLKRMADFCPQGKIYGIDISSESVKFARKEIKKLLNTRCFISQGNVMNLPYEKGTFDLITAFETVYFWGNLQKTFNEVHRVLKNGGLFLICCEASDPSDETWTSRIDGMVESNPMLGLRGVRLSVVFSDLPLMQVRAVATAAARLIKEGVDPRPEIMVPLVSITAEHVQTREVIERVIAEVSAEEGVELNIPVGTMLELPRACMVADEIAHYADFFCFGTNDLTQTTFGFSRDDAEAKFIPLYMHKKILKDNPFETIDAAVLELVRVAVEKGRATNPDMHFGVCGEHGGDPTSVEFCHKVGLNYVSCSPYRVPIARLAAAQAAIKHPRAN